MFDKLSIFSAPYL